MLRSPLVLVPVCCSLALAACDEKPKPDTTKAASASAAPEPTAPPAPEGPPELVIDDLSPKVGFSRVLVDKKDGPEKLKKEFEAAKKHFDGETPLLKVDRKAKLDWVLAMLTELEAIGASGVEVETDTRTSYPKKLPITFQSQAKDAPKCALVGSVLEDRATAIWKLSGGMAMKRAKGMAGPDFTMTGETIERMGLQCKDSKWFFFSADEDVEWGLAYDLAASTQTLEELKLEKFVVLNKRPVAGRPVDL